MTKYISIAMGINVLVNYSLLFGCARLTGSGKAPVRIFAAAVLGGLYAGGCMLPGFGFLGNLPWRCVSMALMSMVAFGMEKETLRKWAVFSLLSLTLSGIVDILGNNTTVSMLIAAAMVAVLYTVGAGCGPGAAKYIAVELCHQGRKVCLTALRDTGNTLRDPVTGQAVLVVDSNIAEKLTGLSEEQLKKPVEVMASGCKSGLQLVPYHSVGNPNGLMLAVRVSDVRIGSWKGSRLVALAPNRFENKQYQALAGGMAV